MLEVWNFNAQTITSIHSSAILTSNFLSMSWRIIAKRGGRAALSKYSASVRVG
ncbi:MAG: hypothetical protein O8C64_10275 [Candidatus Methanoperedens sp.]|nr:hypothetical protein [Candidatus Methanoperedens sp.]